MNTNQENMRPSGSITNEMLYGLIQDMKADMNRRFDEVDRRFDDVYRNLTEIRELIKEEKREREKMNEKLDEVYKERDKVTVRFTRAWMFGSFFIAMLSSTVVLAFDRAF